MKLRAIRSFGPCLLGLFLIAQVAGVLPLLYAHTVGVFEVIHVSDRSFDLGTGGSRQSDRQHHGAADTDDMCCALHHGLTGILPIPIEPTHVQVASSLMVLDPANALADVGPSRLDRPPKIPALI